MLGIVLLVVAGIFALRFAEGAGFSDLPPVQRTYAMLSRWATWLGIGHEHTPYEQARELSQRAPGAGSSHADDYAALRGESLLERPHPIRRRSRWP